MQLHGWDPYSSFCWARDTSNSTLSHQMSAKLNMPSLVAVWDKGYGSEQCLSMGQGCWRSPHMGL